ncbi:MAG: DUF4388 domain-containing protein [Holophagaceae bacterium]
MSQGVIQGSMREAPLADIIQLVGRSGKSGCFHVQQEARRARIYLKEGRLVHAETPSAEGLEALLEVAMWLDGRYHFEASSAEVPTTLTRPNGSLLMAFGERMDEWRILSQKIPSLDLYPVSTLLPGEVPEGIGPRETSLLAVATGYCSVAELAELAGQPPLDLAKDLYGLVLAGLVAMKGIRSGRPPLAEDPVPVTAPAAGEAPPVPEATVEVPAAPPAAPALPAAAVDPQRMVKLMNYAQRIAQTAKAALPEPYHGMVNQLQAQATQAINNGEGPEAVKALALAVSRGAVEAGCAADTVRNLNAQLKALFATR